MAWKKLIPTEENVRAWRSARHCRFLVDENLGAAITELLREWRLKAVDVSEVGLAGRDDIEVFQYAWKHGFVILTHDRGFLDDRKFAEHSNAGIVVLPGGDGNKEALFRALETVEFYLARHPGDRTGTKITIGVNGEVTVKARNPKTGAIALKRYLMPEDGSVLMWEVDT